MADSEATKDPAKPLQDPPPARFDVEALIAELKRAEMKKPSRVWPTEDRTGRTASFSTPQLPQAGGKRPRVKGTSRAPAATLPSATSVRPPLLSDAPDDPPHRLDLDRRWAKPDASIAASDGGAAPPPRQAAASWRAPRNRGGKAGRARAPRRWARKARIRPAPRPAVNLLDQAPSARRDTTAGLEQRRLAQRYPAVTLQPTGLRYRRIRLIIARERVENCAAGPSANSKRARILARAPFSQGTKPRPISSPPAWQAPSTAARASPD